VITVGLDIGSLMSKAVVLKDGAIAGRAVAWTGDSSGEAADAVLDIALQAAGLSRRDVESAVATGAGRTAVPSANREATDILCLARGAHHLRPDATGVIDMGGESTRVLKLDAQGMVVDFTLNDKCASGTGIFLDAISKVMGVGLDEMGPLSLRSTADVSITSTCVVFAESEVVSQVHRQTPKPDILRGIHRSISTRINGMVSRVGLSGTILAVGGLATNVGILACLQEAMKREVSVPSDPQIVNALGAALIAADGGSR
jgi:(R)-2-hydroxyacyl-CoA dehydratese activating ATPase